MTTTQPLLAGTDVEEEIRIELDSVREGVRRYREMIDSAVSRRMGGSIKATERILAMWYEDMTEAVAAEIKSAEKPKRIGDADGRIGARVSDPIILQIDRERLTVITMHTTLSAVMMAPSRGVTFTQLCRQIGTSVIAEIIAQFGKSEKVESWQELSRRARWIDSSVVRRWHKEHYDDEVWQTKVAISVGARLAWLLVGVAMLPPETKGDDYVAAFIHSRVQGPKRTVGILKGTPRLFQLIEDGHLARQHLRPRYVPMIVPPLDWRQGETGGYVRVRTPMVARATKTQREALAGGNLEEVHRCLNAVQASPLRVNSQVLDVMVELVRRGEPVADLPEPDDVPLPERPSKEDVDAYAAWKPVFRQAREENDRRAAKRLETSMRIALGRRFEAYDQFWIPHQLDSRGRYYPVPAYLHYQQSDHSRGIIQFADAKPPNMREVAIHLANMAGQDKLTYDDRVQWVMDHLREVQASAVDPIENRWWLEADKPFQTLAACIAMFDAEAASRLPCQIDGSNNGIQHGAAMTRDADVAGLVNMRPSHTPQDLYAAVLEPTRVAIQQLAAGGDPVAQMALPHVIRDVTKQPTMTTIYGVTATGARTQVANKLEHFDRADRRAVAKLIADTTLASIGTVTGRVSDLLAWLQACARNISHEGKNVAWTSPIGMPVVQSYRRTKTVTIQTPFQSVQFHIDSLDHLPANIGKQRNGIAANFTHSIDGAHKGMVARVCRDRGMSFMGAHDAFLTHSGSMGDLRRATAETFVTIHEQDLMGRLYAEWRNRYPGIDLPPPPEKGDFDVREVLDAEYFFS